MERGRAPRQLARAKSGGSDSDTNEPDTKEVEALADALNHSAELVQTLWFKFLYFMVALVVVIGTTTHRTLFLESPLKLPPLPDIPIPLPLPDIPLLLLAFYIVTPVIFVIVHFYVLLNLVLLAGTARTFEDAGARVSEDGEAREKSHAHRNTLFVRLLVGGRRERGSQTLEPDGALLLRSRRWLCC
jgi:hypothetical protein